MWRRQWRHNRREPEWLARARCTRSVPETERRSDNYLRSVVFVLDSLRLAGPAMTTTTPCPVRSIFDKPCLLPEGHPQDSANRFHRYAPPSPIQRGRLEEEMSALREVAEAAQFLVGSIELGEIRHLNLHAASQVNQALSKLAYPIDNEGLIDFEALRQGRSR